MLRGCRTDNHKHLLLYFETMLFVGEHRGEAPLFYSPVRAGGGRAVCAKHILHWRVTWERETRRYEVWIRQVSFFRIFFYAKKAPAGAGRKRTVFLFFARKGGGWACGMCEAHTALARNMGKRNAAI